MIPYLLNLLILNKTVSYNINIVIIRCDTRATEYYLYVVRGYKKVRVLLDLFLKILVSVVQVHLEPPLQTLIYSQILKIRDIQ